MASGSSSLSVLNPAENDTEEFLQTAATQLNWNDLSGEVVMDIGCGIGNSSQNIKKAFPNIKKIIGIDHSAVQVQLASLSNPNDKITYSIGNIENRFSLVKWDGRMTRVFSIFCFNWLKDQKLAFRNIYHLLKQGGGAAILFTVHGPYYICFKQLIEKPKWKDCLESLEEFFPDSREQNLKFVQYREILEDIGFEVVLCEKENRIYEYPSDKAFRENAVEKFPLLNYLPNHMKEDFKKEYFSIFDEQNGRTSDGRPRIKYNVVTILLRRN